MEPIPAKVGEFYLTNGVLGVSVFLLLVALVFVVRWGLSLQAKLDKAHEERLAWHLKFGEDLTREIDKRNALRR